MRVVLERRERIQDFQSVLEKFWSFGKNRVFLIIPRFQVCKSLNVRRLRVIRKKITRMAVFRGESGANLLIVSGYLNLSENYLNEPKTDKNRAIQIICGKFFLLAENV